METSSPKSLCTQACPLRLIPSSSISSEVKEPGTDDETATVQNFDHDRDFLGQVFVFDAENVGNDEG